MRIPLALAFCTFPLSPGLGEEDGYAPFADPTFPFFGLSVDASPEPGTRSNWVPRGVLVRQEAPP